MRFLGRLFLNCYDLGGRRLFLAELDFVDFVCVEDDCLEGEVEQPAYKGAAYKDNQPYKSILIEFVGNNQRCDKWDQENGKADES